MQQVELDRVTSVAALEEAVYLELLQAGWDGVGSVNTCRDLPLSRVR